MTNKGTMIALGVLALIAAFVLLRFFASEDASTVDRQENFNQAMEETMRATGRRQDIEEELAEERAAEQAASQ